MRATWPASWLAVGLAPPITDCSVVMGMTTVVADGPFVLACTEPRLRRADPPMSPSPSTPAPAGVDRRARRQRRTTRGRLVDGRQGCGPGADRGGRDLPVRTSRGAPRSGPGPRQRSIAASGERRAAERLRRDVARVEGLRPRRPPGRPGRRPAPGRRGRTRTGGPRCRPPWRHLLRVDAGEGQPQVLVGVGPAALRWGKSLPHMMRSTPTTPRGGADLGAADEARPHVALAGPVLGRRQRQLLITSARTPAPASPAASDMRAL